MARILLIEDEYMVREALRDALQQAGHEVEEASNGIEGLKCYEQNQADLVITDMLMPQKEGLETIIELKKKYSDVKIFAISGATTRVNIDVLPAAEGFGALRSFYKPVDISELLSAIEETLGLKTG